MAFWFLSKGSALFLSSDPLPPFHVPQCYLQFFSPYQHYNRLLGVTYGVSLLYHLPIPIPIPLTSWTNFISHTNCSLTFHHQTSLSHTPKQQHTGSISPICTTACIPYRTCTST